MNKLPLVKEGDVLGAAFAGHYAVGAFNANNMELVQAIIGAADETKSPVIVQVSPGAIRYAALKVAVAITRAAAEEVKVPVVLHLDHGQTFEINQQCAEAGFGGLMFDGSEEGLNQWKKAHEGQKPSFEVFVDCVQSEESLALNIETTKRVVKMGHAKGIHVEAEIGHIPRIERLVSEQDIAQIRAVSPAAAVESIREKCGVPVEVLMAIPDQVERFVQETGCDSLAAAIGSIHGMPADIWPIRLDRLKEIQERTGLPIVSHGSSGILRTRADAEKMEIELREGEGTLEEAVKMGLAKVNVATALSMAFLGAHDEHRRAHPGERDLRKSGGAARDAVKELVAEYMQLFGSAGKAA